MCFASYVESSKCIVKTVYLFIFGGSFGCFALAKLRNGSVCIYPIIMYVQYIFVYCILNMYLCFFNVSFNVSFNVRVRISGSNVGAVRTPPHY